MRNRLRIMLADQAHGARDKREGEEMKTALKNLICGNVVKVLGIGGEWQFLYSFDHYGMDCYRFCDACSTESKMTISCTSDLMVEVLR